MENDKQKSKYKWKNSVSHYIQGSSWKKKE